jgi:hypothetical protein
MRRSGDVVHRAVAVGAALLAALSVLLMLAAPPPSTRVGDAAAPESVFEGLGGGEAGSRPAIELKGDSGVVLLDPGLFGGLDEAVRPSSYFTGARVGREFIYDIRGLPLESFDLELSMVEFEGRSPGERVFSVYADGRPLPEFTGIDLAAGVGPFTAWQEVSRGVPAPGGRVELAFRAEAGQALLCHARFLSAGQAFLAFEGRESRQWVPEPMPLRYLNGEGRDVYEAVLGRLGSRFSINPVPQLLGWRQSPLGIWTEDLSEQVLAFRGEGGEARCLPFTDRYPVFQEMRQELRLTGVDYRCSDPGLPYRVSLSLEAPFYPGDQAVSSAPFFYIEVGVENPGRSAAQGEFLFARPHRSPPPEGGFRALRGFPGYAFRESYSFTDSSSPGQDAPDRWYEFEEAVAADADSGVTWHFDRPQEAGWIWPSPRGYPLPYSFKTFTFHPRAHSGFSWSFRLEPGQSKRLTVALACHRAAGVLQVLEDPGYRFIYNHPAGLGLDSVDEVVELALGPSRPYIEERAAFFDGVLREPRCSVLPQSGRDLAAVALQSYIADSWWVFGGSGEEWFAAWEGPPFYFMSTVDVEYNSAWFYLFFWPDLLARQLRQWVRFETADGMGRHPPHDIGTDNRIIGTTYPIFGMEVEECADFILLLFAYWKQTGDTGLMRELYPHAADYARYIMACDSDGDGLPDLNSDNSIDQAGLALVSSRNQTYLGVKEAAALQAVKEMDSLQETPSPQTAAQCEERLSLINRTLRESMWRGDHFAVSSDPHSQPWERDAYSIYSANGLLWLLACSGGSGLEEDNLERLRLDLAAAEGATRREFGCVHTSGGDDNQWVSQNIWRDALGFYLGVGGWAEGQGGRLDTYWGLEHWWACNMNGAYWDSVFYRLTPNRSGPRRGAYQCDRYLDQSLGYYSRGVTVFGLVAAAGRLGVDRACGKVTASPLAPPAAVPVFACADWGSPDPLLRLPVLVFGADGSLVETLNPQLLPLSAN